MTTSQVYSVENIFAEINMKSPLRKGQMYQYRGEPKLYPMVSAKLYRDLVEYNEWLEKVNKVNNEIKTAIHFSNRLLKDIFPSPVWQQILQNGSITLNEETLTRIQKFECKKFRQHTGIVEYSQAMPCRTDLGKNALWKRYDSREIHLLTEMQHLGASTMLIDFTLNADVALYFACHKYPDEDGRIIILPGTTPITSFAPVKPSYPRNRIISQQSRFVFPNLGHIATELFEIVEIPSGLKQFILAYLENNKGITPEYLLNDPPGYVEQQKARYWWTDPNSSELS